MHHKNTLSLLLLCAVLVSSCAGSIATTTHHPTAAPSTVEQPILVAHRPYRVIQLCLDTLPAYSSELFHQATNTIAKWIESDVSVNQDGFVVYLGLITSSSFQISPLAPIAVPAIPADAPEPTPQPRYTPTPGQNPYAVANIQATRDALTDQTHADWQTQIHSNHAAVTAALIKTTEATHTLRALDPTNFYDDNGADVFGCLADAAQHFHNTPGVEHDLIIAATFTNNTPINQTAVTNLADAHVYGIYRPCSQASLCAATDAQWKQTFMQLGADQDVAFYDAQQSVLLAPLF